MKAGTMKVLVVEDSQLLVNALQTVLVGAGFEVLTALDGEEALRVARTNFPDLILLDWVMPKMQGIEVLKALKAVRRTQGIPVVMFSSNDKDESIASAMASGAIGFIPKKSFSLATMVGEVQKFMSQSSTGLQETATQ